MKLFPGNSYWDVYKLPVPIRRWFMEEEAKRSKESREQTDKPLNPLEKQQYRKKVNPQQSPHTRDEIQPPDLTKLFRPRDS